MGPLAARVLVARGHTDVDTAGRFLNPDLERDWLDPQTVTGLTEVADELEAAIRARRRIMVYGDFDVDGLSATAVMLRALASLGVQADYLIPHRMDEGYGLTPASLERILAQNPEFLLTVDCGISAAPEIARLLSCGIRVAVTDHHEPGNDLPRGVALADPKLEPNAPCGILAGVGVALKLVALLGGRFGKPELWRDLTDLAALGTIADMVALTGENRALVADGLRRIERAPRPGIAAVLALASRATKPIRATDLSFSLIPRLNAAGRMGDPTQALELLLTDDPARAHDIALELDALNQTRRQVEQELFDLAIEQIEPRASSSTSLIVVAGENWHEGVRGIVASRLARRYGVPALVFSLVEEEARGSGRSRPGTNLFALTEALAEEALRFGGHEGAIGITLRRANLESFTARLQALYAAQSTGQNSCSRQVDTSLALGEATQQSVRELELFEPCGQENRQPLFVVPDVFLKNARAVGAGRNHLSFSVTDGRNSLPAIWFQCPDVALFTASSGPFDVLCHLQNDNYNGRCRVKLMVTDVLTKPRPHEGSGEDAAIPIDAPERPEPYPAQRPGHLRTEEILSAFLGRNATLHAAQAEALSFLEAGESVLAIMATGRGKSLIFQMRAAQLALHEGKASVFVYPLRALIADQAFHLREHCSSLGLRVEILTGETPQDERDAIFEELYTGTRALRETPHPSHGTTPQTAPHGMPPLLLTTPEFCQLHGWRLAASGRIGLIVVDEAHHLATEASASRPAYRAATQLRQMFTDAQFLALTATASDREAATIVESLGLTRTVIDASARTNLSLDDARRVKDREIYLASLVASGEHTLIYVNARAQTIELAKMLRRRLCAQGERIAFYHAGLPRATRLEVERAFRDGRLDVLVATSAFGEGVSIPDIRHLVLYGMPMSAIAFNQQAGRAGRDGKPATIHLLCNETDAFHNRLLLARLNPSRAALATLYRVGRDRIQTAQTPERLIRDTDEELLEACRKSEQAFPLDASGVRAGLAILAELGLLEIFETGDERLLGMPFASGKVDLQSSSLYLEGQEMIESFERFWQWMQRARSDELLTGVNRPLTPQAQAVIPATGGAEKG
jgi:single-stranded-DNA-specific exonuclease